MDDERGGRVWCNLKVSESKQKKIMEHPILECNFKIKLTFFITNNFISIFFNCKCVRDGRPKNLRTKETLKERDPFFRPSTKSSNERKNSLGEGRRWSEQFQTQLPTMKHHDANGPPTVNKSDCGDGIGSDGAKSPPRRISNGFLKGIARGDSFSPPAAAPEASGAFAAMGLVPSVGNDVNNNNNRTKFSQQPQSIPPPSKDFLTAPAKQPINVSSENGPINGSSFAGATMPMSMENGRVGAQIPSHAQHTQPTAATVPNFELPVLPPPSLMDLPPELRDGTLIDVEQVGINYF